MEFNKNESYYEGLDKRTKEYKEWKDWYDAQPKGAGDTVEKLAKALQLDKVAENVAKKLGMEDCGCDGRKEKLNLAFRYNTPNCLEEDEFVYLAEFFNANKTRVISKEQIKILDIYNRVFNAAVEPSSCGGCLKKVLGKLNKLVNAHKA